MSRKPRPKPETQTASAWVVMRPIESAFSCMERAARRCAVLYEFKYGERVMPWIQVAVPGEPEVTVTQPNYSGIAVEYKFSSTGYRTRVYCTIRVQRPQREDQP